jgi:sugar phosphate permease
MVSGLLSTSHELGIALVLPVLSTVAASSAGGLADAFVAAAAIAAGAAVLAFTALRRSDVAPGTRPAMAAH